MKRSELFSRASAAPLPLLPWHTHKCAFRARTTHFPDRPRGRQPRGPRQDGSGGPRGLFRPPPGASAAGAWEPQTSCPPTACGSGPSPRSRAPPARRAESPTRGPAPAQLRGLVGSVSWRVGVGGGILRERLRRPCRFWGLSGHLHGNDLVKSS